MTGDDITKAIASEQAESLTETSESLTETSESLTEGRARERADVVDFIRHPPGRVPEHQRSTLAELASAIERGQHVGWASRLYDEPRVERTLTEELTSRGMTHRPEGGNGVHVIESSGRELFRGRAGQAWEWLRELDRDWDRGADGEPMEFGPCPGCEGGHR